MRIVEPKRVEKKQPSNGRRVEHPIVDDKQIERIRQEFEAVVKAEELEAAQKATPEQYNAFKEYVAKTPFLATKLIKNGDMLYENPEFEAWLGYFLMGTKRDFEESFMEWAAKKKGLFLKKTAHGFVVVDKN